MSISREENKRINEEGLVFNFSEAGHFANLFKVLVEFFLDGKAAKRFEKKCKGKVDDLPSRMLRLKAFLRA